MLAIMRMCLICSLFYLRDLSLILMILSISSSLRSLLEVVLVGILVLLKIDNRVLSIYGCYCPSYKSCLADVTYVQTTSCLDDNLFVDSLSNKLECFAN